MVLRLARVIGFSEDAAPIGGAGAGAAAGVVMGVAAFAGAAAALEGALGAAVGTSAANHCFTPWCPLHAPRFDTCVE